MERHDKLQGVYWYDFVTQPWNGRPTHMGATSKRSSLWGPTGDAKGRAEKDLRLPAMCERARNSIENRGLLVVGQRAKWPNSSEYFGHSLRCYCSLR